MKVFLATLVIGLAATMLMVDGASASDAGTPSTHVSNDMLARMGMADMEIVSDQEGHQIRGQGWLRFRTMNFTFIWGRPVEVRQLILVGSKTSPAQAIGVSYNYSLVW